MNSIGSNKLSLKYQRFTISAWKDIGIKKLLVSLYIIFYGVHGHLKATVKEKWMGYRIGWNLSTWGVDLDRLGNDTAL